MVKGKEVGKLKKQLQSYNAAVTPTPSGTSNPSDTEKDYLDLGFILMDEDINFIFDNSPTTENVVKMLGEPESKSETIVSWVDGCAHQMWNYTS